jgi:small subunit ribosomal protein S8
MKESILDLLEKEGYVGAISKKGKKVHKSLEVGLVYDEYGPRVKGVKRMSKLSKRMYGGVKDIKPVKQGHGMLVLSTPKGILSDTEAKKQKVGGELLFKVW